MNACIDIGNTRTKIGFFSGNDLSEQAILENEALSDLMPFCNILENRQEVTQVILSASGEVPKGLREWLQAKYPFFVELDSTTLIPLKNLYHTPQTLGKDRIAVAVGASEVWKSENVVVVQLGTCITYNVVSAEKAFLGGNISPGLMMRLEAMHHFTARLPLVKKEGNMPLIGYDTDTALRSGAIFGMATEIDGTLQRIEQEQKKPFRLVIGGGDAETIFPFITHQNKNLSPDLGLIGLNIILNYHFSNLSSF